MTEALAMEALTAEALAVEALAAPPLTPTCTLRRKERPGDESNVIQSLIQLIDMEMYTLIFWPAILPSIVLAFSETSRCAEITFK